MAQLTGKNQLSRNFFVVSAFLFSFRMFRFLTHPQNLIHVRLDLINFNIINFLDRYNIDGYYDLQSCYEDDFYSFGGDQGYDYGPWYDPFMGGGMGMGPGMPAMPGMSQDPFGMLGFPSIDWSCCKLRHRP